MFNFKILSTKVSKLTFSGSALLLTGNCTGLITNFTVYVAYSFVFIS